MLNEISSPFDGGGLRWGWTLELSLTRLRGRSRYGAAMAGTLSHQERGTIKVGYSLIKASYLAKGRVALYGGKQGRHKSLHYKKCSLRSYLDVDLPILPPNKAGAGLNPISPSSLSTSTTISRNQSTRPMVHFRGPEYRSVCSKDPRKEFDMYIESSHMRNGHCLTNPSTPA